MSNKNASKRAGGRSSSWHDEQLRAETEARRRLDLPICDVCGEPVVATLCGTNPSSPASREAIRAVLLAAHKRLAHETAQS